MKLFDLSNFMVNVSSSFVLKCILCAIILYLGYRDFNYWTKRGIPGPKPVPIFGNTLQLFLTPRPLLEREWLTKFGKMFGLFVGNKPILIVAEPELIKHILVKDFDVFPNRNLCVNRRHPILCKNLVEAQSEDWRRIRSIVSPAFSSSRMKKMYPTIKECVNDLLPVLEGCAHSGCDVNVQELFGNFTMDVIASCAFATKIKNKDSLFMKNARTLARPSLLKISAIQLMPEFVLKYLNIRSIFTENSNEFLFDLTRLILKERKNKSNENFDDFTQLIMSANRNLLKDQDDNQDYESHHVISGSEKLLQRQNSITKFILEEEILAQSWIFFMAGYETTSMTLSYAAYELALNQDSQQRLYEEVLTAVDANGDIDYDLLSRLPFLDSVISETLRMHSPFLRAGRRAVVDYKLGDTGLVIKKNSMIEIPIYAIHLSEDFYPDPLKFDPDRFMPANRHKLIPYTYLPFGGGPRNCIGLRFALMEIKTCLTQMIFRYILKPCSKTDIPVQFNKSLFINSPRRLFLKLENRCYS